MRYYPSGVDLVIAIRLQDDVGAIVTDGDTLLYLYEEQSDGTLKSYDFTGDTFKTTALTTETAAMTHRTGNNSTRNTGIWTKAVTSTGFTAGKTYRAVIENANAYPTTQEYIFQYGGVPGDNTLDLANGIEAGLTIRQGLRLMCSAMAAKLSGGGTGTETMRNAVADSKDRMVVTVDSNGNRSAITYDLT